VAKNVVVIGTQWGDEGKGKVVDLLTEGARGVVRFQGGHNAGHTVIVGSHKTVLHLVPSGILHADKACFLGNGVVVAPGSLIEEMEMLEAAGIDVRDRLLISGSCPIILPSHVALDQARELAKGDRAIGTTGRGIGPAYEDKVARRAIHCEDLRHPERCGEKLREVLDYHNFLLTRLYEVPAVDYAATRDQLLRQAEALVPLVGDVAGRIHRLRAEGCPLLFEGAQGTLLDVDHGTYPYVTSSNTTAGYAAAGSGMGPRHLDYYLGITKAYATRVGGGPFPTELSDALGEALREKGKEYGATTGRPRRCGWFDAVAVRRAVQLNSLSGLCVTKLDVMDGLPEVRICMAYRCDGQESDVPPLGAEGYARCEPVYETLPGWSGSTAGCRDFYALPAEARAYLERLAEAVDCPLHMVSTGAERQETIVLHHPFG
jgi:adenylosuccinate synthase